MDKSSAQSCDSESRYSYEYALQCQSPRNDSTSVAESSPDSSEISDIGPTSQQLLEPGALVVSISSTFADEDLLPESLLLILKPSDFPKTLATPGASRLFQHFFESTAGMLAARPDPQNPYAACLLPLAAQYDYVMHAVLACSGSHCASSKQDDTAYALSREHYAVALRAAKYQITRFSLGKCEDHLALVALLLTLCQFEVGSYPTPQTPVRYKH